ncbi:hypothetical protein WPS_07570 [Vulcanimicrobium alpinum]|uniref:Uncharacterized protein n=1 Tax=Vulcanimicrobium alpinum TaxID=3016050 RepID=A0AAN1XVY6_UNVUL|nr:hypothetical protein [Vulcanimicrobium alpinum]BDE05481.1 hypothetical protein WPS_07570 [Vulcanimicrobium alpinum]
MFYPIGFRNPSHKIFPEESYNIDASWEHQFNGTDASFKLTPYLRQTKNELTTVLLDAKTSFVSGINVGHKNVKGLELAFSKGDIARDGWYTQLGYTYTFARVTFDKFQNGTNINTALNNAIARYNAYTSFCATNPSDARCNTTFGTPATTSTGTVGAPCFTAKGAPDPACAAGSVANPYWNMPVQSFFDPGGRYPVYNTYSGGLRGTGSNQSYIPPHVLTLIANYKRGPWNFTPTAQFQGGAQYGRPLQVVGVDPAAGCSALNAATTTNGDPRYPGTQAGSPYNAATCGGSIVIPDPFVKHFDNYGQFTEPNKLGVNLTVSYDLNKQSTLRVDFVNVVAQCFGGTPVPWNPGGRAGCNFGGGTYGSNFYNPGDTLQPGFNYPYAPTFGNVFQSVTGAQANPFELYATLNIKF